MACKKNQPGKPCCSNCHCLFVGGIFSSVTLDVDSVSVSFPAVGVGRPGNVARQFPSPCHAETLGTGAGTYYYLTPPTVVANNGDFRIEADFLVESKWVEIYHVSSTSVNIHLVERTGLVFGVNLINFADLITTYSSPWRLGPTQSDPVYNGGQAFSFRTTRRVSSDIPWAATDNKCETVVLPVLAYEFDTSDLSTIYYQYKKDTGSGLVHQSLPVSLPPVPVRRGVATITVCATCL